MGRKFEQYHHENQTWVRSLDFFRQENSYLKTRLSEMVDGLTDKNFLALAEHFQNQFIVKDEFMAELLHDIHAQQELLKAEYQKQVPGTDIRLIKKHEKLSNEMEYLEKDFARLRGEFNKYLTSVS